MFISQRRDYEESVVAMLHISRCRGKWRLLFIFIWLYIQVRNGPATGTRRGLQQDFKADVGYDIHRNINRKVKLGIAWYNPFWKFHLVPLHWFRLAFLQYWPICASSELQSQSRELWPLSRFLRWFSQPAFAFSCCHPLKSHPSLS